MLDFSTGETMIFKVLLKPVPDRCDGDGPDAICRLRGVLKRLGRTYGFQCISVEEIPAEPASGTTADDRRLAHHAAKEQK